MVNQKTPDSPPGQVILRKRTKDGQVQKADRRNSKFEWNRGLGLNEAEEVEDDGIETKREETQKQKGER